MCSMKPCIRGLPLIGPKTSYIKAEILICYVSFKHRLGLTLCELKERCTG